MGCVRRKIRIENAKNASSRKPRKPFPTVIRTLGDELCLARLEQHITQRILAKRLGVEIMTVVAWENDLGLPSPENLQSIQRVLGTRLRV